MKVPFSFFRQVERGIGLIEVLVAGALLAVVVLGSSAVFSLQKHTLAADLGGDQLRDVAAGVNVDAAAIAAYDPAALAALQSAQQIYAVPVGGPAPARSVTVIARPASGGLSVVARGSGVQASLVAPFPSPQATP